MKSAALEPGSYGITVNAVIPGLIGTALTRHKDRHAQAIGSGGQAPTGDLSRDEETAKKLLAAKSPPGVPWIGPADVAPVAFLASDEARMVSGASFAVTAGDSANITAQPVAGQLPSRPIRLVDPTSRFIRSHLCVNSPGSFRLGSCLRRPAKPPTA